MLAESARRRSRSAPLGFGVTFGLVLAAAQPAAPASSPQPALACPAQLIVRQNQAANAGGWTVGILPGHHRPRSGRHALSNISIAEGPPEQQGFLAPDDSRRAEGGLVNRWTLGPSKLGYWLICEYEDSGANLNLRLGGEIGRCAIRYDAHDHVLTDSRAISCGP